MIKLPELPVDLLLRRLDPPTDAVSVVIDTDTYNEIDDQFAVIYALLSEKLKVESALESKEKELIELKKKIKIMRRDIKKS